MAKRIALILASILGVYMVFAAMRGLDLLKSDDPAVKGLGIAVLVLPLLGIILVFREIRFGKLSYEMGQTISEEHLPLKEATEEQRKEFLENSIAKAKADMDNWQAWYAVALGYDLLHERKFARDAMQYSVELYQNLESGKAVNS